MSCQIDATVIWGFCVFVSKTGGLFSMKNKKEAAAKILKRRKSVFYWKAEEKNLSRAQMSDFDCSLGVEYNIFIQQHWRERIAALRSSRVANCWGHLHFWVETTRRERGNQEVLNKFSDLNFLWKFYVYCYLCLVKQDLYHWHYKNSYIIDFFFQLNAVCYSTISCCILSFFYWSTVYVM